MNRHLTLWAVYHHWRLWFVVLTCAALLLYPSTAIRVHAAQPVTGSWTQLWAGIGDEPDFVLTVDPFSPSTLYVGTHGTGVFKSLDGGSTWAPINSGFGVKTQGYVTSVVVDPTNSSTVYAGIVANEIGRAEIGTGLFKSTNGGASWAAANTGIVDVGFSGPPADVQSIAIDPSSPNRLWAALQWGCGSIYWSVDAAASWTRGVGLPCDEGVVRLSPSDPQGLYTRAYGGIYPSADGGRNWLGAVSSFGACCVAYYGLAIDPLDRLTMIANDADGVYRSADGGLTWSLSLALPDVYKALTFDPVRAHTIYAGRNTDGTAQVEVSTDGGVTWADISNGLPAVGVKNLTVAANAPNRIYATTNHGVYVYGLAPAFQYAFGGFRPPVDAMPVVNTVKAGSAVPVKFTLGGDQGLGIFADGYPKSQQMPCGSNSIFDGIEQTASAGSMTLSYDTSTQEYTYVWKTDKAWAKSCQQLVLSFADGSVARANFSMK